MPPMVFEFEKKPRIFRRSSKLIGPEISKHALLACRRYTPVRRIWHLMLLASCCWEIWIHIFWKCFWGILRSTHMMTSSAWELAWSNSERRASMQFSLAGGLYQFAIAMLPESRWIKSQVLSAHTESQSKTTFLTSILHRASTPPRFADVFLSFLTIVM